ncbi:MAG: cytochrome b/b6 domain-containing protein [Caldimonas sp.]
MTRVWDRPVRALHWALAASVVAGWVTTEAFGRWHQPVGYAALAIVVARLTWSGFGNRYARFNSFLRSPRATWRYASLALRGHETRHVGHNPLGACMVVALIVCVAALALTGWLYTTDRFWGSETVERFHLGFAWAITGLAVLHVAGVVFASVRHRENLVASMVHGHKRDASDSDID